MSFNNPQTNAQPVTIKDEGVTLVSNVGSLDFTGAGVSNTAIGSAVTTVIPGGGAATSIAIGATITSSTAYGILLSDASGNLGQVVGTGTASYVLTSNGAGALPTWSAFTGGTVLSVSVVTAQGVSGTVATSTTTPAITLALGALTGVTSFNGLVVTANTGAITTGTWNGTVILGTYGGTGVNNSTKTFTYLRNISLTAADDTGVYTLPTGTKTLLAIDGSGAQLTGIPEGGLSLTDITTNDSSTSKHGFLDKLPGGTTTFKRADGAWATPSGTVSSYLAQAFTAQTSVVVTHSFGAYPVVDVIDNTGAVIIPLTITHSSINAFTVTFTGSTTGTIMASVGSPQPQTYVAISGTYAILASDYFINATGGTFTATLPTAVGRAGQTFALKNSGTGVVTLATTSSQTIDGELTNVLAVRYQSVEVASDGANWFVF